MCILCIIQVYDVLYMCFWCFINRQLNSTENGEKTYKYVAVTRIKSHVDVWFTTVSHIIYILCRIIDNIAQLAPLQVLRCLSEKNLPGGGFQELLVKDWIIEDVVTTSERFYQLRHRCSCVAFAFGCSVERRNDYVGIFFSEGPR